MVSNINVPEMKLGLSDDTTIPLLGFGTAAYPLVSSETIKQSILQAIEVGYRHFDTAAFYDSEQCLGEAIAEALALGLIKYRDELFITSKLWCTDAHSSCAPCTPKYSQSYIQEFCKERSIHITAFCPLGARGTWWENKLVLDSDVLNEIAKARGKTVAQVCLRLVYQQGVSVIVKSFSKERMKENMGIFDWTLSIEECQKIEQISSQHKG